jgi:hypothetical protein
MLSISSSLYAGEFTDNYSEDRINQLKVGSAPYNSWEAFQDLRTDLAAQEAGTYFSGVTLTVTGITFDSGGTITSPGEVTSPFSDDGTAVTASGSPTKFIYTHSTGNLYTTQMTSDDFYGSTNAQNIDLSTNNAFKFIDNGDTFSVTMDGNDSVMDSSDGGVIFKLTDATDGTVDFMCNNDVDDYIQISTTTNQPLINFVGCNGKITAASGTIDFDNEILTTTGTLSAGATTVTSLILGDETISVAVDDEIRFASNDETTLIEAYGFEDKNGGIQLTADEGDDAGDKFQIVSTTANTLIFTNDTTVKDTHATILTLDKTGLLTTTGDIIVVNDSATANAVQDVATFTSSTTGTAAAGLGVGLSFNIEDLGGVEQQGSMDVALTTETNGAEDADIIFSQNIDGTITETFRLNADGANTMTNGLTVGGDLTATGAIIANGAVTLGNAIGDIVTVTGKVAGATPLSFDGDTADTVYTILAVDDAADSSKTVTLPSVTGRIALETAATTVITADTTATITVVPGTDTLYTYTVDTDDENCTLTFSAGGSAGDIATIIFITDAAGSNDEVMTFDGTLSDSAGTLTLANGASKRYVIRFISDGTIWNEISRTTVLG